MKKKRNVSKQLLSIFICLAMVVTYLPLTQYRADLVVALVGETAYTSFDNALANWTDGTTLTLLADVTYAGTDDIRITEKTVTLDLNGHTLTLGNKCIYAGDYDYDYYEVIAGNLTIKDSGASGKVSSDGTTVDVWGTFTLESGTLNRVFVKSTGTFTMTGGKLDNQSSVNTVETYGTVNISGGEISSGRTAIWTYPDSKTTISGSPTITGKDWDNLDWGAAISNAGTLTISDTPTLSGGSAGEIWTETPFTLNTNPKDGNTWRVLLATDSGTGIFAQPVGGVTLDPTRFACAIDDGSYGIFKNGDGELEICKHSGEFTYTDNGDETHKKAHACCGAVAAAAEEHSYVNGVCACGYTDKTAPAISGVENDKTYYTTQKVTVTDTNLDTVTLNDTAVTSPFTLDGNKTATYTIVATDKAGNTATVTVKMQPVAAIGAAIDGISENSVTSDDKEKIQAVIDDTTELLKDENLTSAEKTALEKIKSDAEKLLKKIDAAYKAANTGPIKKAQGIKAENVTHKDKTALQNAKADLQKALNDYRDNYTAAEKKALEDELVRIEGALKVIANVEAFEALVSTLPESVTKDDEAAIKAAADAYSALTDYEKSLVSNDAKKALDDATAALAALNKPSDSPSPDPDDDPPPNDGDDPPPNDGDNPSTNTDDDPPPPNTNDDPPPNDGDNPSTNTDDDPPPPNTNDDPPPNDGDAPPPSTEGNPPPTNTGDDPPPKDGDNPSTNTSDDPATSIGGDPSTNTSDNPSPSTADNCDIWLWFALLFVSGTGVFGLTLNQRKRRLAGKR